MKVYMVAICGRELCHHFGVYSTYEGALRRWNEERLVLLARYEEWQQHSSYDWTCDIKLYSATTPEEHLRRADLIDSSMDVLMIHEYDVLE